MATKVYESFDTSKHVFTVNVKNDAGEFETKTVIFDGGFNIPFIKKSFFTTNDPKIQEALEKSKLFNSIFRLADVIDEQVTYEVVEDKKDVSTESITETEVTENQKVYPEVTRVQDAKEVLIELGVSPKLLKNKEEVLSQAKAIGVIFPNL
jgi:hypothetical protein